MGQIIQLRWPLETSRRKVSKWWAFRIWCLEIAVLQTAVFYLNSSHFVFRSLQPQHKDAELTNWNSAISVRGYPVQRVSI
jgi:hypothetical protein